MFIYDNDESDVDTSVICRAMVIEKKVAILVQNINELLICMLHDESDDLVTTNVNDLVDAVEI